MIRVSSLDGKRTDLVCMAGKPVVITVSPHWQDGEYNLLVSRPDNDEVIAAVNSRGRDANDKIIVLAAWARCTGSPTHKDSWWPVTVVENDKPMPLVMFSEDVPFKTQLHRGNPELIDKPLGWYTSAVIYACLNPEVALIQYHRADVLFPAAKPGPSLNFTAFEPEDSTSDTYESTDDEDDEDCDVTDATDLPPMPDLPPPDAAHKWAAGDRVLYQYGMDKYPGIIRTVEADGLVTVEFADDVKVPFPVWAASKEVANGRGWVAMTSLLSPAPAEPTASDGWKAEVWSAYVAMGGLVTLSKVVAARRELDAL